MGKQVKAVPDGYRTVTAMLNVKGAAEAIEWFKKAFGAEERDRMLGPDGTIMHAEVKIGDSVVMISDAMMNPPLTCGCHLYVENADMWWKRAVDAGAKIEMPIADMFWGDRFGVLSDKWGNRWSVGQHLEDVAPAEMSKRTAEWAEKMKQQMPMKKA